MEKVYQYLMNNWSLDKETEPARIASALKESNAFEFMILWSVLETKLFNKFCHKSDLAEYSHNHALPIYDIDEIIEYFHDRYRIQGGKRNDDYKHLIHQDVVADIDRILEKPYDKLTDKEKCHFMLYVVFRYRNNIFHGNKGVDSWSFYRKQINKCVDAMIFFIDNHTNV